MPLDLLEPGALKDARRVLRGRGRSNAPPLPDRALRGPVVVRKNCYGSGSRWAATLAARTWTITATASRAGINPLAYLRSYLDACADAGGKPPAGEALEAFFPWAAAETDLVAWRAAAPDRAP